MSHRGHQLRTGERRWGRQEEQPEDHRGQAEEQRSGADPRTPHAPAPWLPRRHPPRPRRAPDLAGGGARCPPHGAGASSRQGHPCRPLCVTRAGMGGGRLRLCTEVGANRRRGEASVAHSLAWKPRTASSSIRRTLPSNRTCRSRPKGNNPTSKETVAEGLSGCHSARGRNSHQAPLAVRCRQGGERFRGGRSGRLSRRRVGNQGYPSAGRQGEQERSTAARQRPRLRARGRQRNSSSAGPTVGAPSWLGVQHRGDAVERRFAYGCRRLRTLGPPSAFRRRRPPSARIRDGGRLHRTRRHVGQPARLG